MILSKECWHQPTIAIMMRHMKQRLPLLKTIPVAIALMAAAGHAAVPPSPPATTATPPPASTPAAKTNHLDAVFEATTMATVTALPKVWTDLVVLEAVPHGARVNRGDSLVKLDLEKLRDQVQEWEADAPSWGMALQLATAELENLQTATPLKLEAARRTQRIATEDLAYFEKTGRREKERAIEYNIKGAQQRLNNDKEELKQLEKMYKADDLVEETEEIILQRQRFAVELSQYNLDATKLNADWSLRTTIPREAEFFNAQKRDQDAALTLATQTLPSTLARKQFDLEKLRRDTKKSAKRLADMKADLEQLALRAPVSGLVYYGACESGKWTTGAAVAKKLLPGGKLQPGEIIMTVVAPEKMRLKAVIAESDLAQYKTGTTGIATLVSAPDTKFSVRIDDIGAVPLPAGGFEASLSVTGLLPGRVTPGMTCKIVFDKLSR
jgi:multidrug resistance efflux pump